MKRLFTLFYLFVITLGQTSLIAQVNLSEGLVSSYSFSGNANDESVNALNGTISGAVLTQDKDGRANSAYLFNGSSKITLPNNSLLNITSSGITLMAWIKPTSIPIINSVNGFRIIDHTTPLFSDGYTLDVVKVGSNPAQLRFIGAFNSSVSWTTYLSNGAIPMNTWTHVAVTYNGDSLFYYINGVIDKKMKGNQTLVPNNLTTYLGLDQSGNNGLIGSMDEVKIYNKTFNATEIKSIYSNTNIDLKDHLIAYYPFNNNFNDYSTNSNHITTVVGTQFATNRYGAALNALSFAGGDNRVLAPSSLSLNSVTNGISISMWIYQTSANCPTCADQIANYGYILLDKYAYGATDGGYRIDARGKNGGNLTGRRTRFLAANSTLSNIDTDGNKDYSLNEWHHIVATFDLAKINFYLDNLLVSTVSSSLVSISGNNFHLAIGGPNDDQNNGTGFNFKGLIDEVRIYNRAINSQEVNTLFNAYEVETPSACRPTTVTSIVQLPASKFGFYSIDKSNMDLVFIDTSGSVTTIGNTEIPKSFNGIIGSLDFDKNGTLWYSGVNDSLFTINTSSGKSTFVSKIQHPYINVTNGVYYDAISFNSKNEMYSWIEPIGPDLGQLVKITNIQLGTTTTLSGGQSSDLPEVNAIAFGKNDTLWSLDQCCYRKLHILSTSSGLSVNKSINSTNQINVTEMDYSNGAIYGINIPGYQNGTATGFFKVDRSGNATSLFSLKGQYIGLAGQVRKMYPDTIYITKHDTVVVTKSQTVTVISFVTVTGLNTGGEKEDSDIKAYPNPTTNKLSVTSESGSVYSVEILDSKGIVILTSYSPNSIELGDKAKGIYLLKAKGYGGNVLKTFKIMIE